MEGDENLMVRDVRRSNQFSRTSRSKAHMGRYKCNIDKVNALLKCPNRDCE
jgi:hypothetical protein